MEETKQSRAKSILCIVLAIILIASIGIGAYFLVRKDDDNSVKGTEVELASYAINKANARSSVIYDTYAKTSAGKTSKLGALNSRPEAFALNASDVLSLEDLENYFFALQMCNTVPAAMDFVIQSSKSEVYTNTFELGKTYMARDYYKDYDGEDITDIYYYTVKKNGSLVDCYLSQEHGGESAMYICQINYDFSNDKLISAKTIVWQNSQSETYYIMLYIDYSINEFTSTQFTSTKTVEDLMSNNIKYNDISKEYFTFYRGNIVENINSIDFEDLSNSGDAGNIFDSYYNNFTTGIEYKNVFDYDGFVINNSFIDAMEYSTNKLDFYVRVNPNNKFEYQYISTWMEYEDVLQLLADVSVTDELKDSSTTKQLLDAYINRLKERGKYSYTGNSTFERDEDNLIDIVKVRDEIDTYMVCVITEDEGVFECKYQYKDGKLVSSESNTESIDFRAEASGDGTYAIITGVQSKVMVVNIPEEIEVNGTMLPVKSFDGYCYGRNGMILNFPAGIEEISARCAVNNVREINVHKDNAYYSSVDGVLYNKDKTELISYPEDRVAESFTIPNGVTTFGEYAFESAGNIKSLTISKSVVSGDFGSAYMDSLTEFKVEVGSTAFSSYNGILYNADGTELIMCPARKTGVIDVKNGTLIIGQYSFWNTTEVTQINLPNTLTTIRYAFGNCPNLKTITIPDSVTSIEFGMCTSGFTKMVIGKNNTTYAMDENNFVYSKDKKTLYFVPGNISGVVTIPSHVTKIGTYVFSGREGITEIIVPESVTELETRAFGYYSGAEKITFKGAIELDSWNYGPFSQAYDLEELTIAELIGELDWEIFDDCENFHTINFGGTKVEFEQHLTGEEYDLNVTITVHCTDGDLTYI